MHLITHDCLGPRAFIFWASGKLCSWIFYWDNVPISLQHITAGSGISSSQQYMYTGREKQVPCQVMVLWKFFWKNDLDSEEGKLLNYLKTTLNFCSIWSLVKVGSHVMVIRLGFYSSVLLHCISLKAICWHFNLAILHLKRYGFYCKGTARALSLR